MSKSLRGRYSKDSLLVPLQPNDVSVQQLLYWMYRAWYDLSYLLIVTNNMVSYCLTPTLSLFWFNLFRFTCQVFYDFEHLASALDASVLWLMEWGRESVTCVITIPRDHHPLSVFSFLVPIACLLNFNANTVVIKQGMKHFTRTAANLLAAVAKVDNCYYPEVSKYSQWYYVLYCFIGLKLLFTWFSDITPDVHCQCWSWIQKDALACRTKVSWSKEYRKDTCKHMSIHFIFLSFLLP